MKSWNLIFPLVVSASKSGAMLPRRRLQEARLESDQAQKALEKRKVNLRSSALFGHCIKIGDKKMRWM